MKKTMLLLLTFFTVQIIVAQDLLMSDGTFMQCDGFFIDSGGNSGSYGPNENFTLTICSNNPSVDGSHVNLQFSGIEIGGGDLLCFYDGADVTAPLIACNTTFGEQVTMQATAANPSGCLTVTFMSDGSGQGAGWAAAISCVPSCQTITAELISSIPAVNPVDTGWIDVCPGDRVFFTGAGSYPQDGIVYNHSDFTSNFEWNFGDGVIEYGPTVSHTYDVPGGYVVQLLITDQLGCYSTNFITQRVRVSGPPNYNLLAELPDQMCVGEAISLSASVNSNDSLFTLGIIRDSLSFQLEGVRSDSIPLPDGTGEVYETNIAFSEFSPGQFLQTASDIVEVCVIMEHSFLRDLVIRLECPDGTEVILHEFVDQSGGEHHLGIPYQDDESGTPIQGTGWEYCWRADATNGTWIEYCDDNNPLTLPAGDYQPFDSFDNLIGCPLNGEWAINVEDLWGIDNGWIFSWSITFEEDLYPNIEKFSPAIDSFSWVNQPSIIYYEQDSIVSVPMNAGTANYTFEIFDEFGCNYDTALNLTVLPVTHPDCYNCLNSVTALKDTTICPGEMASYQVDYLGPTNDAIIFESFPLAEIGAANHPLNNPFESRITISNVNPLQVINPDVNICRVCFTFDTHPSDFASDINVWLVSPNGSYLELTSGNGGIGHDFTNTCFTTTATAPINTATGPFTGDYIPEGDWSNLAGSPINGQWILLVSDALGSTTFGEFTSWDLCFNSVNEVSYTWAADPSLSCTNCPNPTMTPLTTTTYNLEVADSYGCVQNEQVTVNVQQQLAGPTITDCISGENGLVEIVWDAVGGATGYQVSIDNGPWIPASETSSHILVGLDNQEVINISIRGIAPSANCAVGETDFSCVYERPCTLAGDIINVTETSCYGATDGSANFSAFDGINPITFSIDGAMPQTSGTFDSLVGGDHFIVVLDDDLCFDTVHFVIPEPAAIEINFQVDSTGCNAGNDGLATAEPTGGIGFYTYQWNTAPIQITPTATNLYAGIFTVTVTDSNNCSAIESVEVFQPMQLNAITTQDSVSCFGLPDGAASVSASGGALPYTYEWSDNNGQIFSTAEGLPAGTYYVTVTDANGCFIIEPAVVLAPPEIIINATDLQDAYCFNGSDGSATVEASGGVAPFSYSWVNGQTGPTATNLMAGDYTVVVTDSDGCVSSQIFTIGHGDPINLEFTFTEATCSYINDGSATVHATGGAPGTYTFLWDDENMQTDSTVTGLLTGNYTVAVTDSDNCTTTGTIFVPAPPALNLMMSATTTSCPEDTDGTAAVVVSGGAEPYMYQWNDDLMQTFDMIFNLSPGMYVVTVTDGNNCVGVDSVEVTTPNPMVISGVNASAVSCFGLNNGEAEVIFTGGTAPYSFLWSDPLMQFGNPSINLFAGNYGVTITDANGCSQESSVEITEPTNLNIDLVGDDVLCFNEATGSAIAAGVGGTPPFTYQWSSGELTGSIGNLEDATYFVTVTDNNGCQADTFVIISEPATSVTTTIGQNLVGCFAANQGVAEVIPSGGTGMNYLYAWSSGVTTSIATDLSATMQYVTITDENSCEAYDSILIQEYGEITGNIITIEPSCFGGTDGQMGINIVSGGVGSGNITDYTYEWSTTPIQAGDFIQNLEGGITYTVTITDMEGCTGTASVLLDEPPLIIANPQIDNGSCFGLSDGSITLNPIGLNSTYTYQWGSNANNQVTQSVADLQVGTYAVTIVDDMGCMMDTLIMISEPDALSISLDATTNLCEEDSLAVIQPTVNGGTTPYFYQWSTGETSSIASGLSNDVYFLTVTDVNDCEIIDSIEVFSPMPLWAEVSADSVQCFGDENGTITIAPNGGQAPYSYSLDGENFGGATTMIGLAAGSYQVYVRDVNGCEWSIEKTVLTPPAFMVAGAADSLFIELGDSIRLFSSWENGRGFVQMFWNAPYEGTLSCVCEAPWASPDFTIDYELYGVDEYGCDATDEVKVIVSKPRGIFVPTGFTPNDDGVNDNLYVFGREGTEVITYRVYDRWGERVFESLDYIVNDETKGWDGNFRSRPAPGGVYQWVVEVLFLDGLREVYSGHTTLIR